MIKTISINYIGKLIVHKDYRFPRRPILNSSFSAGSIIHVHNNYNMLATCVALHTCVHALSTSPLLVQGEIWAISSFWKHLTKSLSVPLYKFQYANTRARQRARPRVRQRARPRVRRRTRRRTRFVPNMQISYEHAHELVGVLQICSSSLADKLVGELVGVLVGEFVRVRTSSYEFVNEFVRVRQRVRTSSSTSSSTS